MRLQIVDEGVVWKNRHPSVRSLFAWHGHTVNLGGGELLHAMRVGQARSSLDCRCLIVRSTDSGRTWNETTPLLADEDRDPDYSYFTARLGMTSDGRLWASSIRFHQIEPEDARWTAANGGWIDCENFISTSSDRGQSWSSPQYVGPERPEGGFPTLASPIHELASGELMLVFEAYFTRTMEQMRHRVTALYSRDGGDSWGEQTVIAQDPKHQLIYFDPRLTRLADGSWICFFWTHDKQTDEALNTTVAYSEDGHNWTSPRSTQLWGFPTLPLTLPDGRLFAVYNYRRMPQGVRCAVSEDQGKNWDMRQEYVLWDQMERRATGETASSGQARDWEGSCLAEMFTWDFGVPEPTLMDDGTVLVTFYATELDHVTHQRYVRIQID